MSSATRIARPGSCIGSKLTPPGGRPHRTARIGPGGRPPSPSPHYAGGQTDLIRFGLGL